MRHQRTASRNIATEQRNESAGAASSGRGPGCTQGICRKSDVAALGPPCFSARRRGARCRLRHARRPCTTTHGASPVEPECHQPRRDSVPRLEGRSVRGDLSGTFGPARVASFAPPPPQSAPCSLDRDRRPRAFQHQHSDAVCTCAFPVQNRTPLPTSIGWNPCRPLWRRNVGERCRHQQQSPPGPRRPRSAHFSRYGGMRQGNVRAKAGRHGKPPTFLFYEDSTRQQLHPRVGMSG